MKIERVEKPRIIRYHATLEMVIASRAEFTRLWMGRPNRPREEPMGEKPRDMAYQISQTAWDHLQLYPSGSQRVLFKGVSTADNCSSTS
jgi:hypothetical protein